VEWLKWWSAYLAGVRPWVQILVQNKKVLKWFWGFFFFGDTWAFHLLNRLLSLEPCPSPFFCFSYFSIGFHFFGGGDGARVWTLEFCKVGANQAGALPLEDTSSLFCSGYFGDGGLGASWTICLDWLQSMILPTSVSQVARIIGSSQAASLLFLAWGQPKPLSFSLCLQHSWYCSHNPTLLACLLK
jgi:hypothetical protein